MEAFWISFLHIFFLCAAVCIDTFAAAFGFGIDQIRIPALSALVLSLVSSAALSLSMLAAGWLTPYLPAGLTGWLSCALLCGLGLLKLFDSAIKRLVRRLPQPGRELSSLFCGCAFCCGFGQILPQQTPIVPAFCPQPNPSRWPSPVQRRAGCRAGRRIFRPFPLGGVFLFRRNESDLHSHRQPGRKKSSPAAPALTCPGWAASSFSEWGCWPLCKSIFSAP